MLGAVRDGIRLAAVGFRMNASSMTLIAFGAELGEDANHRNWEPPML